MDPAAAMAMGGPATVMVGGHHHIHHHDHSRNPSQLSAMSEAMGGTLTVADVCSKTPPVDGDGGVVVVGDADGDTGGRDVTAVVVDEKAPAAERRVIGCGPVTIVQTTPASNPPGTVIVTVSSANNDATNVRCRETEMDILAHL